MNFKACIFDLDGVVVDTAKYHYMAWKRLADELGFTFTKQDNEQLKGVSRMQSLDILLKIGGKILSKQEKIIHAERKNKWYREFILKMTPDEVLSGAIELFKELKQNNYKIALGSASKNANTILTQTNIKKWFDVVIDGNKTQQAKPNPEVFLLAARELNIQAQNCIVFEDAMAGVSAAKTANMKCIGIGNKTILKEADHVVNGLFELNLEKLQSL